MFNNSSTVSHSGSESLNNADNNYDFYTNNASAVSIYTDLNSILNSNRSPDENLCELSQPKKHSYSKNDLFKIRNERSDLIKKQVPALISQSLAYKLGQPFDISDQFAQTNSFLSLKESTIGPVQTSDKISHPKPGQMLLSLIKNTKSSKEASDFVPNKKKSDPLQQFALEHPDLLNEYSTKRKIPSALTVQQVESNLICQVRSPITVHELESMQLGTNQTIYEDSVFIAKHFDEMEVEDQSNELNEQDEINIDLSSKNRQDEKQHFKFLIEKLNMQN